MATSVALFLSPGEEDPAAMMSGGKVELEWGMPDGSTKKVTTFKQVKPEQIRDDEIALPTLYLHTLDKRFMVDEGEYSLSMRSGNDNSELMLALPDGITGKEYRNLDKDAKDAFEKVVRFLNSQGEVMAAEVTAAGSLVNTRYATKMNSHRLNFKLKTSRPKAGISLPKKLFGIPEEADSYLFAENHISVNFMSEEDKEAVNACIDAFAQHEDKDLVDFSIFLKVFYEGGFAYNKKKPVEGGYVPTNLSITSLGVTPAFEGQVGIGTGYPYKLSAPYLPFVDTVPVTIGAIAGLSERHKRYGLCFTRCVHVWEGEDFARDGSLSFTSILPHGGFYYAPETLQQHQDIGGLVYSFGESKEALTDSANQA